MNIKEKHYQYKIIPIGYSDTEYQLLDAEVSGWELIGANHIHFIFRKETSKRNIRVRMKELENIIEESKKKQC